MGLDAVRGDSDHKFEALSSLFTGLAFVGMLCTLYMQGRELKLQRQELEETKEELKGTKLETQRLADATDRSASIEQKKLRLQQIDAILPEKYKELHLIDDSIKDTDWKLKREDSNSWHRPGLLQELERLRASKVTLQKEIDILKKERRALLHDA